MSSEPPVLPVLGARHAVAAVLAFLALVWLRVNSPVEGAVLVVVTPHHGLTVADLPALAALVLAVVLAWPRPRR